MKKFYLLLLATALVAPCMSGAEATDTVKVINNPNKVTITKGDGKVKLKVDGSKDDKDYQYEYKVTTDAENRLYAQESESGHMKFRHPFSRYDSTYKVSHWEVFTSDLMFGWGRHSVADVDRDCVKKSMSEIGILNLVALGHVFNQGRSRVSLGIGFNWHRYGLEKPYFWSRGEDGVLGYNKLDEQHDKHRTTLLVRSMQFPLMFNQSLGKSWNVAVGAVMNWNFFADYKNTYRIGKSDYSETTRGLNQRKISFDGIAMLSWRGLGMYFRYAPQSVMKDGFGPEIKNRWTLGLVLRGFGFGKSHKHDK